MLTSTSLSRFCFPRQPLPSLGPHLPPTPSLQLYWLLPDHASRVPGTQKPPQQHWSVTSFLPSFLPFQPTPRAPPSAGDTPEASRRTSHGSAADERCEHGTASREVCKLCQEVAGASHMIEHHPYLPCLPGHGPSWLFCTSPASAQGASMRTAEALVVPTIRTADSGAFFAALQDAPSRAWWGWGWG